MGVCKLKRSSPVVFCRFLGLMALSVLVLLTPITHAGKMTVGEAYRAIPHRQTQFDPHRETRLKDTTKARLRELFDLTDQAMALRVQAMLWIQTQGKRGISYTVYEKQITPVIHRLQVMESPGRLKGVQNLLTVAITEQKDYLSSWSAQTQTASENHSRRFNPNHGLVKRSHRKLLKAYNLLLKAYPSANTQNKQAFFDHLCALDFL